MTFQLKIASAWERIKVLAIDIKKQIRDGELQLVAASLSFSTAIALIPFLAVVLATFQSIGNLEVFYPKVESMLLMHFKTAAGSEATKWIRIIIRNVGDGRMGVTGAIVLFITSLRLLHDMEVGIHRVWNLKNRRPLYKRIFAYWIFILLLPFGLAVYVGLDSLEQLNFARRLIPAWFMNAGILYGSLYALYKYVPDIRVKDKAAIAAALLAGTGLWIAQISFKWLGVQVFNYNRIYGALGAVPLLLIWMLTMWNILLAGVAISASIQKRHLLEKEQNTEVL